MLIGIAIQAVLSAGQTFSYLTSAEDVAMDFVMRQFRNVAANESGTPFVLLEADQATFEQWDQPFYFHRDRLQDMIEFASGFDGGSADRGAIPALIIVDVDLAKAGATDEADKLASYLERYSRSANPPLILVRTLRNWPDDNMDALPRERPSFLDRITNDDRNMNIFWASPHYVLDNDYRIRRWLLWLRTRVGTLPSTLPSVQLLAQKLLDENDSRAAITKHQELVEQLNDMTASCASGNDGPKASYEITYQRGDAEEVIDLCGSPVSQRLIYSIPYGLEPGEIRPKVESSGTRVPVLERQPAAELDNLDRGFVDNSVVVIGGTYRESRDWYATPIGEMPGAMIVVNAVNSLTSNGPLQPPPLHLKMAIVVVLVLFMSVAFSWLNSFVAFFLVSALTLLALVPLSFAMFRSGVWIDFALPLLAVQLHYFARDFRDLKIRADTAVNETTVARQLPNDHESTEEPEPPLTASADRQAE